MGGQADIQTLTKRIEENSMDLQARFEVGKVLFRNEDFTAAEKSFDESIAECESVIKKLNMWKRKCETHKNDNNMSSPKSSSATKSAPKTEAPKKEDKPKASEPPKPKKIEPSHVEVLDEDEAEAKKAKEEEAAKPAPTPAVAPDVRTDWYQTSTVVTVCFFIKMGQQIKGSKDHAKVNITERRLDIEITLKDGSTYTWKANPLSSKVNVAQSTYKILPMKIEVSLIKQAAGENWERLEGEQTIEDYPEKVMSYPTSNKKAKDKNWVQIEKDAIAEDPGASALDKLLKEIYGEGNPEVQRAMNKSFVESNGTVLSTNWNEVGEKFVEGAPPKGMEAKKWSD